MNTLSRTWFFRLSSLAFVALATSTIAVYMRGLIGFLLLISFAIIVGLLEKPFIKILHNIAKGVVNNKLLVLFTFWYFVGMFLNSMFRGNGLSDWRLFLIPLVFLLGIFFSFAFAEDKVCYRQFQVLFILVSGIQSFFTSIELFKSVGIARIMWVEAQGAWIFGNQSYYSAYAILLPMLFWRSFKESGILRTILLVCCCLIFTCVSISTFGTPLGLIILGILVILSLSILFMARRKGLIIAIVIIIFAFVGYRLTFQNTMFADAYSRLTNLINDPTSGGYSESNLAGSRWFLNGLSLKSFLAQPLFGMGGGNTRYSPYVGGHSSFFDSLGCYGLLGGGGALSGIILFMLFRTFSRFLHKHDWENLLALTCVILLLVAGVINPYWEGWQPLFVLLIARPFIKNNNYSMSANRTVSQLPSHNIVSYPYR